ncbi:MAG: hypothetical protein ACRCY8_16550 [Dermatophilaceae bacterium]
MSPSTASITRAAVRAASTTLSRVPGARRTLPSAETAEAHVDPTRWRSVTVFCEPDDLAPGAPALTAVERLGHVVDVRRSPAPADKGVELSVRARPGAEHDPAWGGEEAPVVIRRLLRETKMRVETGEVLHREPQPEGRRTATPAGRLVDRLDASAREEGLV